MQAVRWLVAWRTRWRVYEYVRNSLWIVPSGFMAAAVAMGITFPWIDEHTLPSNSISVAAFLLLLSMLMFLRLLTRTIQGLQMAAVLRDLGRDARRVVDRVYPEPARTGDPEGIAAVRPEGPVRAVTYLGKPGVVQSADATSLIKRARRAGAVIELVPRFGDFIAEGSALFRVHGDRDGMIDDEWLQTTVATGDERTMRQDPGFAFRLLADISAKALSLGTYDPATSVQALDQIELLLHQIANRRLVPSIGRDATGTIRLWYRTPSWQDYLSLAIDETRHYGKGSVLVVRRLRTLLDDLRASVPEFRRPAVDAELALLDAATGHVFSDSGSLRPAAPAGEGSGLCIHL